MADAALGVRDDEGNWRPPKPLEIPAPFHWPPRPVGTLKWLFGYPGYLWPWNTVFFAFAFVAWFFFTPSLASMQTFEIGWIAQIFGRNLAIAVLFYGSLHLWFYVFKTQGIEQKYNTRPFGRGRAFVFNRQVGDNIFWSLASGVTIWTAYEVVTWWLYANNLLPFISWASNPVWFVVLMLLIPLIREVHFYLIHRLLHWRPLYEIAHKLHHRNVNIGPWSGLSMHPIEHLLYFSGVIVHWIIASHPLHAMFHLMHLGISPAPGHSGYESIVLKDGKGIPIGAYMHYLHHNYIECNYGGDGLPLIDKLMGTFHDGSDEAHERMNQRIKQRQWARAVLGSA